MFSEFVTYAWWSEIFFAVVHIDPGQPVLEIFSMTEVKGRYCPSDFFSQEVV